MATEAQREAFVKDNAGLFGDLYINLVMTLREYGINVEHTRSLQNWTSKMMAVIVTEIAAPPSGEDDNSQEQPEEQAEEEEAKPAVLPTADGKEPAKADDSE